MAICLLLWLPNVMYKQTICYQYYNINDNNPTNTTTTTTVAVEFTDKKANHKTMIIILNKKNLPIDLFHLINLSSMEWLSLETV